MWIIRDKGHQPYARFCHFFTFKGGIISTLLLNVALNGLQQELGPAYGYIRYADDLVVCASSREKIEEVQTIISKWLQMRDLALHPEKTRIVHIDDGFNFLGFSIRRYKGKCLIKPQKEKMLAFLANQRACHQTSRSHFAWLVQQLQACCFKTSPLIGFQSNVENALEMVPASPSRER